MSAITFQLFPDDLQKDQQDVYEVILADWGTNSHDRYPLAQGQDGTVTLAKGLPFPPAAIAIGPQSTVDRAWFSWNPMIDRLFFGQSVAVPRLATFENAIMYPTPSGSGLATAGQSLNAAMVLEALYAFPVSVDAPPGSLSPFSGDIVTGTGLPVHYLKADGTQQDFYTDGFPAPPNVIPGLITPQLHLQFFRRAPLSFASKRLPLRISQLAAVATFGGGEQAVLAAPIYGRKRVVATFGSNTAGATWRAATLHAMSFANGTPQEVTEATSAALAANASSKIVIDNPAADYLILYVTPAAPANLTLNFTVTAID